MPLIIVVAPRAPGKAIEGGSSDLKGGSGVTFIFHPVQIPVRTRKSRKGGGKGGEGGERENQE